MIQIEVIQLNSLLAPSSADYEHSDMRPVQTERHSLTFWPLESPGLL